MNLNDPSLSDTGATIAPMRTDDASGPDALAGANPSSMMAGLGDEEVPAIVGASAKRQTTFLATALVIGAVSIFGMRMIVAKSAAQTEDASLEYTPGEEDTENNAAYARVMTDLDRSGRSFQIPAETLPDRPFTFKFSSTSEVQTSGMTGPSPEELAARARERELADQERRLSTALATITLQGVIGGRTPVARIDGKAVRKGDTVAEIFTAVKIGGRSVILESEGRYFMLSMGREPQEIKP